jgi:hypothetical protein
MELLERDAAAKRCGIKPASLTHAASASQAKVDAGGTLDEYDCPLPVDRIRKPRPGAGKMGPRRIRVPRWDPDALDRWRAAGRRPADRQRDGAGRYLSASP